MISKTALLGSSIALLSLSSIAQTNKILPGIGIAPSHQTCFKSVAYTGFNEQRYPMNNKQQGQRLGSGCDRLYKKNNLTNADYISKEMLKRRFPMKTFPAIQNNELTFNVEKNSFFLNNRRNRYSTLWAFASLNYLYADLAGLMDKNMLKQYQNGVVDGTQITPGFLSVAAGLMQIPLANVFLPQVIKNEQALKWVQIASGIVMTLVQSGTLFMGKPAPYYILFSAIEIGTTAYITFDAIKWKTSTKNPKVD